MHENEILLINKDGSWTKEGGKLFTETTGAYFEALAVQLKRQRIYFGLE